MDNNNNYQNQNTENINIPPFGNGNDNPNYQNYNNQNPDFRDFNNANLTQQNSNNFYGYNQYPNRQNPYNNYRPQPKSNNTALVAAVSVLGVLLVAVIIFAALWFSGIIGRPVEQPDPIPTPPPVEEKAPEVEPTSMYVANVKNSIYFRSEPVENDSNIKCEIPVGTAVAFLENTTNVFAKISYNGEEGYVKREYLSATPPAAQPAQPAPSASSGNTNVIGTKYVANVKTSIYFRTEPSENSSNIICEIPLHTAVGYIERTNGTFSKIYYNGRYGYVKTQYLSSQQSSARSNTSQMTVCNVAHSIYLRSKPVENPDNIICEIPVNSTVTFIEEYNSEFYQISWNGYLGYAKAIYLR